MHVSTLVVPCTPPCSVDFVDTMKYVAAYLLLALKGDAPSQDAVKALCGTAGIEVNDDELARFYTQLGDKVAPAPHLHCNLVRGHRTDDMDERELAGLKQEDRETG